MVHLCEGERFLVVEEEIVLLLLVIFPNRAPVQQLGHLIVKSWWTGNHLLLKIHLVAVNERPLHCLQSLHYLRMMDQILDQEGWVDHLGFAGGGIRNVIKSWIENIEEIFDKTARERLADQAVVVVGKHPEQQGIRLTGQCLISCKTCLLNVSQTTTNRSFLSFMALCSGDTQSQFARDSTHTCMIFKVFIKVVSVLSPVT